jgi:hypothetical protein
LRSPAEKLHFKSPLPHFSVAYSYQHLYSQLKMDWYPEWEQGGRAFQRWMEDYREAGCPYPKSTFSIAPQSPDYYVRHEAVSLHPLWQYWTVPLGLPTEINNIAVSNRGGRPLSWEGRTGYGMIFLDWICRSRKSIKPHIREFTKAVYEMDFPLDSLRYVFVTNVVEESTIACVLEVCRSFEGLSYPCDQPQSWSAGSREYHALLGTTIGNVVAGFVLCAWGQGRKRIDRIVTFHTEGCLIHLNMRFDLADV